MRDEGERDSSRRNGDRRALAKSERDPRGDGHESDEHCQGDEGTTAGAPEGRSNERERRDARGCAEDDLSDR